MALATYGNGDANTQQWHARQESQLRRFAGCAENIASGDGMVVKLAGNMV
jgi:hypothetical protein